MKRLYSTSRAARRGVTLVEAGAVAASVAVIAGGLALWLTPQADAEKQEAALAAAVTISGAVRNWQQEGASGCPTITQLQRAVRDDDADAYREYARAINDQDSQLATLRGLLRLRPGKPVAVADVEPTAEVVEETARMIIDAGKVPVMLGGEHTATVGACAAHDRDVLYIDAHADYRDEYLGERVCHATVARRLWLS